MNINRLIQLNAHLENVITFAEPERRREGHLGRNIAIGVGGTAALAGGAYGGRAIYHGREKIGAGIRGRNLGLVGEGLREGNAATIEELRAAQAEAARLGRGTVESGRQIGGTLQRAKTATRWNYQSGAAGKGGVMGGLKKAVGGLRSLPEELAGAARFGFRR